MSLADPDDDYLDHLVRAADAPERATVRTQRLADDVVGTAYNLGYEHGRDDGIKAGRDLERAAIVERLAADAAGRLHHTSWKQYKAERAVREAGNGLESSSSANQGTDEDHG